MAAGIPGQASANQLGLVAAGGTLGSEVDFIQSPDGGKTWGSTIVADNASGTTYGPVHGAIDEAGDTALFFGTFSKQNTDSFTQLLPAASQTFNAPVDVSADSPGNVAFDPCQLETTVSASGSGSVLVLGGQPGSQFPTATTVPGSQGAYAASVQAFAHFPGDAFITFFVRDDQGCTSKESVIGHFDPQTCRVTFGSPTIITVDSKDCPGANSSTTSAQPSGTGRAMLPTSGGDTSMFASGASSGGPGTILSDTVEDFSSSTSGPPIASTFASLIFVPDSSAGLSAAAPGRVGRSHPLTSADSGPFTNPQGFLERDFNGYGKSTVSESPASVIVRSDGSVAIVALDNATDPGGNPAPNLHLLQGNIAQSAAFSDAIIVPAVIGANSSDTAVQDFSCAGGNNFLGCFLNYATINYLAGGSATPKYETMRCSTGQ